MKRWVAALLLVATLLTSLVSFSGCATGDAVRTGGKINLDPEGFTLVFPDPDNGEVSATFREQAKSFASRLSVVTGVDVRALSRKDSDAGRKVILVGETGDGAARRLSRSIKGEGFAIKVKKNSIVIAGSTPVMTMYALQYLTENYLTEESSNGKVTLPRRVRANRLPTMELANSEGTNCSFVYDASLDTKEGNPWREPDNAAQYDYPYAALLDCLGNLAKVTELKSNTFVKKADTAPSEENEIVVGIADRDEVRESLATLSGEAFGVFVKNGKTLVLAHSDTALSYAHGYFRDLMSDALIKREDGTVSVQLPIGLALTGLCFENYATDFPKPDGVTLYNTQDAGDKSLQYLYMGDGVNADAFRAYCTKLEGEGYALLCENEIEESLFATFVSEAKNTTLYVAYNAFVHASGNYNYKPRLKVISASLDSVTVPDERLLSAPESFKRRTDASVTALPLVANAVGMGYVIMLEDGSFVIFDGGRYDDSLNRLWNILVSLHTRAHGKAPSGEEPIHISAWVITHSHNDHYDVFFKFLDNYGRSPLVKLDYVLGNYPSQMTANNAAGRDFSMGSSHLIPQRVKGDCKFIKIHTGQRYYFPGLEIEVLYTQEDANPVRLDLFNDTSCIMRFTMQSHNTDEDGNAVKNSEAKSVTSIWTGDAFIYGSRFASAMYGKSLQSDMVQVAHHGNVGCESHFYRNIRPTAIWFPHVYESYRSYTQGGVSAWQYKVDYDLVYDIGTVKYAYVSDTWCVTLPLRASGADYSGIFDAITGESVDYGSRSALQIKQK